MTNPKPHILYTRVAEGCYTMKFARDGKITTPHQLFDALFSADDNDLTKDVKNAFSGLYHAAIRALIDASEIPEHQLFKSIYYNAKSHLADCRLIEEVIRAEIAIFGSGDAILCELHDIEREIRLYDNISSFFKNG